MYGSTVGTCHMCLGSASVHGILVVYLCLHTDKARTQARVVPSGIVEVRAVSKAHFPDSEAWMHVPESIFLDTSPLLRLMV